MQVRKSLAIAMFAVGGANEALAADWSGPFVGMTGGYGGGHQTQNGGVLHLPATGGRRGGTTTVGTTTVTLPSGGSSTSILADGNYQLNGGLVGGAVGYNWQSGHFVYGLEGDGSWADVSADSTCGFAGAVPHGCGGGFRSLGTVRGRIGYDITPGLAPFGGFMIYGTGGFAVATVHAWDGLLGTGASKVQPGWAAGGGFEAMFGEHWSVNVEYLHLDLGTHALFTAIPPNPERIRTTGDLVRVGLSYHFNTAGPAPVIARY